MSKKLIRFAHNKSFPYLIQYITKNAIGYLRPGDSIDATVEIDGKPIGHLVCTFHPVGPVDPTPDRSE